MPKSHLSTIPEFCHKVYIQNTETEGYTKLLSKSQCRLCPGKNWQVEHGQSLRPNLEIFSPSDLKRRITWSKDYFDLLLLATEAGMEKERERGRERKGERGKEKERETEKMLDIWLFTGIRGESERWQVKEEAEFPATEAQYPWGPIKQGLIDGRMLPFKMAFPLPLWIRERPEVLCCLPSSNGSIQWNTLVSLESWYYKKNTMEVLRGPIFKMLRKKTALK